MSIHKLSLIKNAELELFKQHLQGRQKPKQAELIDKIIQYKTGKINQTAKDYLMQGVYPEQPDNNKFHKLVFDTNKSYEVFKYQLVFDEIIQGKFKKDPKHSWEQHAQQLFNATLQVHQSTLPALRDTVRWLEHALSDNSKSISATEQIALTELILQYREQRNALEMVMSRFEYDRLQILQPQLSHSIQWPEMPVAHSPLMAFWLALHGQIQEQSIMKLNTYKAKLLHNVGFPALDQKLLYQKLIDIYALMAQQQAQYGQLLRQAYQDGFIHQVFPLQDEQLFEKLQAFELHWAINDVPGYTLIYTSIVQQHGEQSNLSIICKALDLLNSGKIQSVAKDLLAMRPQESWDFLYQNALLLIYYWDMQDGIQARNRLKRLQHYLEHAEPDAFIPALEQAFQDFITLYQLRLPYIDTPNQLDKAQFNVTAQAYKPAIARFFEV
jgi:hypothetical protein